MQSSYTFIYLSISGYLLNYIFYINYNRTVSHFLSVAPSGHHNSNFPPLKGSWLVQSGDFQDGSARFHYRNFTNPAAFQVVAWLSNLHHPKRNKTAPHCCRRHSSLACAVFRWVRRRKKKIIFFLEVNKAPFQFIKNSLEERKQAVNEAACLTLLLRPFLLLVSAYVSESNWKLIQWDRLPTLIVQNHKVLFQLKSHKGRKQNWLIMPACKLNCECTFLNGY